MSTDSCAFHFEYPFPHQNLEPGCQFTGETELFDCDGESYCRFHLPLTAKEGNPTPKGEWNEAEVEAFNVTISRLLEPRENETDDAPVNLSGVVLPGEIDLSERELVGVLWYRALFPARPNFQRAVLKGDAYFEDAQFTGGDAYFEGAQFTDGRAVFRDARFTGGPAVFQGAQFTGGYAVFRGAQFTGGDADFQGAQFTGGYAYFKGARFAGGPAVFQGAQFTGGPAVFQGTQFTGGDADFRGAQFTGGDAVFEDAQFTGGDAVFLGALFTMNALFGWSKQADSRSARQGESVGSNKTQEELSGNFGVLDFKNVHVQEEADFGDRTFTKAADFSGTTFEKAPTFHGCQLHEGTSWLGTKFLERIGYPAEKAYRKLRRAMEEIRDRPQEAVFFALEQQTMRNNLPRSDLGRWFSLAYDWTCGYGNKLGRPMLWLAGTTALFFVLYWIIDGPREPAIDLAQVIAAFCIQQIVRPFWVWSGAFPDLAGLFCNSLSFWIKLLATLQSVLSLAFIGLFVLVLRWKFRRA